jgi:hypothetical protein
MTLPGFRGAGVLLLGGCQAMIGRTAGRVVSSVTTFNTGFHMDKFARFPHIFVRSSKVQSDLRPVPVPAVSNVPLLRAVPNRSRRYRLSASRRAARRAQDGTSLRRKKGSWQKGEKGLKYIAPAYSLHVVRLSTP